MSYDYRFVTSYAILRAAQEKLVSERNGKNYRGPIGSMNLNADSTIQAFHEFFTKLGDEGWLYCGTVEYPELPYGGVYCFSKIKEQKTTIKKSSIRKVEILDEQPIEENERQEYIGNIEEEHYDYDISSEIPKEELMEADSNIINDVLFRQNKIIAEEDPDRSSNIIEELANMKEPAPLEDVNPKMIRHQLYVTYETENKGKKSIFKGKETKGFVDWLDTQKSSHDPLYKDYTARTGKCALSNGNETVEFKTDLKAIREAK